MTKLLTGRSRRGLITLLASMALVLAMAAPAFSASTPNGYRDQGGRSQGQVEGALQGNNSSPGNNSPGNSNNTQSVDTNGSGTLPFTGMELGLVLAMGAALLGVGVGLRRVSRPPTA
jgi:hypothetical protein